MNGNTVTIRRHRRAWQFKAAVEGTVIRRTFRTTTAFAHYLLGFFDPERQHTQEAKQLITSLLRPHIQLPRRKT